MTDRVNGLLVVLDYDIREDDPKVLALMDALRQMKNVTGVTTNIANPDAAIAEMRVKSELLAELSLTLQRILRT